MFNSEPTDYIFNFLHTLETLENAIEKAQGNPKMIISVEQLRVMSAVEMINICAKNNIRFFYDPQ